MKTNSHIKLIVVMLVVIALTTIGALYFVMKNKDAINGSIKVVKIDGVFLPQPQEISDFELTDNHGKPYTKSNLKGHWTFVFFGFTNCGMVCPTTLSELNKMYKTLEKELPANQMPHIVLISVDPDRDTVERMNDYVSVFNTHFIGLRGGESKIDVLKKQLHIASVKMQTDQGKDHYTINHSAEIMVFNPQVQLQAFFSYPHIANQMVRDYKLILTSTKG
ncbi:MAG: SCO family protein [Gammaproteobacteria bacterium]|nr:SCO family protein [Gammaproteobacteria bacterium]